MRRVATQGGTAVYDPRTDEHHHLVRQAWRHRRRRRRRRSRRPALGGPRGVRPRRGPGRHPRPVRLLPGSGRRSARGGVSRPGPSTRSGWPAPSFPTAPATRLVAPARIAAAAKTPGRTVSSRWGARSASGQASRPSQEAAPAAEKVARGVDPEHAGHRLRARLGADHHEDRADGHALLAALRAERDRIERPAAVQLRHLRSRHHLDARRALEAVDQVARHGAGERRRAPPRTLRVAREVGRGLPGRVPPPTTSTSSSRKRSASGMAAR